MIDLGSLRGLHAHAQQLAAWCPRCARWSVLDLTEMIETGLGERRLPLRVRCSGCGAVGQMQVRPPAPTRDPTDRWPSQGSA